MDRFGKKYVRFQKSRQVHDGFNLVDKNPNAPRSTDILKREDDLRSSAFGVRRLAQQNHCITTENLFNTSGTSRGKNGGTRGRSDSSHGWVLAQEEFAKGKNSGKRRKYPISDDERCNAKSPIVRLRNQKGKITNVKDPTVAYSRWVRHVIVTVTWTKYRYMTWY